MHNKRKARPKRRPKRKFGLKKPLVPLTTTRELPHTIATISRAVLDKIFLPVFVKMILRIAPLKRQKKNASKRAGTSIAF